MRDHMYKIAVQFLAFNGIVWFFFEHFLSNESGFDELTLAIYIIFMSITSAAGIAAIYVGVELYLKKLQQIEDMDAKNRYGMYLINAFLLLTLVTAGFYIFPLNPIHVVFPIPFLSTLAALSGIYILVQGFLQRKKDPLIPEENATKADKSIIYLGLANLIVVLPGTFLAFLDGGAIGGLFFFPSFALTPFMLTIDIIFLILYLRRHKPEGKKKKIITGFLILSLCLLAYNLFWWGSAYLR